MQRLPTERLDIATSRLPYADAVALSDKRVVVVGCGALGAGVARLLAQSGIGHFALVDPDSLGWENIRRHELGAPHVGRAKAKALAAILRRNIPEIGSAESYEKTFYEFAGSNEQVATTADLVISCTGDWSADASVESFMRSGVSAGVAVYGWMEAHALAAHAVLIGKDGPRLQDGFDESGEFRLPATDGGKPAPPECGGSTSPFGAVELAAAQALVARIAIDVLRGKAQPPAWRTWMTDAAALQEAEAAWSPKWLALKGTPPEWSGVVASEWLFK
jgi:hypothetical protein